MCDSILCKRFRGKNEKNLQSACKLCNTIAESVQKKHWHSCGSNSCLMIRDILTAFKAASSSRRGIVFRPGPLMCDFAIINTHLTMNLGKSFSGSQ